MAPDLTDRDRERFAALRASLEDVERAEPIESSGAAERGAFDPMLATTFRRNLDDVRENDWIAERKFDGTRIILQKFDGEVGLFTRRHIDRAQTLPDLTAYAEDTLPDGLILDGEYCFLNPEGVSRFLPIHQSGGTVQRENLTPDYYAFDVLAQDGEWCRRDPLLERKERLVDIVADGDMITPVSHETSGFQEFYDDLIDFGEEGIMLKRRDSPYHAGVRSDHWRKVKAFTEADVIAVGYTPGEGRRKTTFGALVLSDTDRYIGRVGSGFDRETLEALSDEMSEVDERPISQDAVGRRYTPIEPIVVRVKFQEVNNDGKLRAPVFLGHQTEKPVADVEPLPTGEEA